MREKTIFKPMVLLTAAILLVFTAGVNDSQAHRGKKNFPTKVFTRYGIVEGYYNTDATVAWKSVPFAKPPVGDLRWKAPEDPERWRGVLDATQECEPCSQLLTYPNWVKEPVTVGSEDCLYLDIYRPKNRMRHLPVYVYFHGGANHFGSKADYDGSKIAEKSNMVVVVVQQRLGPIGWLTHPSLRNGESALDDSGNYGTLDNIKALEWIQKNIRFFGGNPHNVTITGESAGAHNVMNMVISPLATGLFHKAMSESGGMTTKTVAAGEIMAEDIINMILANQGVARDDWDAMTLEEQGNFLRNLDASVIWGSIFDGMTGMTFDAIQDGTVVPGSVVSTIRSGNYNKVPIILGANKSESKAFMPLYGPLFQMPWINLLAVMEGYMPLEAVFPTDFDLYLYNTAGYYGSRNWRAKFVDERARALADQQGKVYAYQFNWGEPGTGPEPFDVVYGAMHTLEIGFFFGDDTSTWGYAYSPDNDTPGRQALSDAMMKYLSNFARYGDPNGPRWNHWCHQKDKLPTWKPWSNEANGPKAIFFDANADEAILTMSNEEVDILAEMGKLEAELATWPAELELLKNIARGFQWQMPE